jgi:hypothetical protein
MFITQDNDSIIIMYGPYWLYDIKFINEGQNVVRSTLWSLIAGEIYKYLAERLVLIGCCYIYKLTFSVIFK